MSSSMEARPLMSAMESPTFEEDSSIRVEQPVGAISISPCGRDVVLASKEGLHVIDLDSPYSPPRYLPHHTSWEVADVQWSPFASRDYWVVSTSNQKALVWNLAMKTWQNSIEFVLHAHSRAITDINFSAFHPDLLATCAVDSFVHCWDLRSPSRPAISFSDWFTGATQVKWNRQDPHVIASSHDRFLRIWDDRMGAYPIKSIEAHDTKIYGVDWNRVRRGALTTCSLDKTIKFWDYTSDSDTPEKMIKTPFPIWRARNTPFGWGVAAMPQRGNGDLHLYSRRAGDGSDSNADLPLVHSFPGHKGQIKEFLWRPRGGVDDGIDHREFQLVTWGTDRELRLHRVNPEILERVGYEKGKSFISTRNVTRLGAVYRSFRDVNSDLDLDFEELDSASSFQNQATTNFAGGPGMNAISVPHARGWTKGAHVDTRMGMQPRSNLRADTNPIAWMRGVKISGWDIETLGDEISHVGEKFTKVAFEYVDVRQRKICISLNGPWGANADSIFLKVDIKFPVSYPKTSIPTFNCQRTTGVTDELASRISAELRTIAETYMSRKRGCLEGAVRYLLGESSLEESVAWILGETGENVKSPINGELEGESSDEDEVGMTQSQELGMSSELLRPVNANVMVPVAKACGALWANDGRLICFFPPKKDKSTALFENLGFKEMSRLSRTDKVFEGFGRLQTSSPGPRTTGTGMSTDDGASDYSDDSYTETSSSSGSSDILSGLPTTRFQPPQTWRSAGSMGIYRPRSMDHSQRSLGGAATAKSAEPVQNVISIHDLSDMLPVKRELASKYRICGKGTDVCAHNAAVALEAGCYELAQIWGLIKLILHVRRRPASPTESKLDPRRGLKRQISDRSYNLEKEGLYKNVANSVIRWGDHPMGSHWLVPALFDHFERIGDVQMIAMLSCVLFEASHETHPEKAKEEQTEQQAFPVEIASVPSTLQNKSQAATPASSVPRDPQAIPHTSARSSSELWRVDSSPPHSTGTTPPHISRPRGIANDRKAQSNTVSIAASPDQQSNPRSGSGFGSVLASSLSRSFTFGPSSASPPVNQIMKKKQSPRDSPSVATIPATQSDTESDRPQPVKRATRFKVTFKNQNAFSSDDSNPDSFLLDRSKEGLWKSYRAAYADILSMWDLPIQRAEVMKIGTVSDETENWRTSQYWNSHSSKISSLTESPPPETPDLEGLDFQRHCANCGHPLQISIFALTPVATDTPSKRNKQSTFRRCPNCNPRQPLPTNLPCIICGEIVDGMLVPCLSCGHVSCFDCHSRWFLPLNSLAKKHDSIPPPSCPSGCGCNCSEHVAADMPMPMPAIEPVSPELQASHSGHSRVISQDKRHRRRQSEPAAKNNSGANTPTTKVGPGHEDDLDLWQTSSPFASLARGMGGGLSQGLRSRDDRRKNRSVAMTTPKRR